MKPFISFYLCPWRSPVTVQIPDLMYFGEMEFVLIDIEEGKQIIEFAEFAMPEHDPDLLMLNTACWRGYAMEYHVIRDILYGIKDLGGIRSPRTMIPYTGSCIIARGDNIRNTDFIEMYLDADEAFELYFEEGVLKEKFSLDPALEEARATTDDNRETMDRIARKHLRYRYGKSTYKWLTEFDDDLEEDDECNEDRGD